MNDKFLSMVSMSKKAGKCIEGVFLTDQNIRNGKAKLVLICKGMGKSNKNDILNACKNNNVQVVETQYTAEQFGSSLGKEKCVSIAITDDHFKKALLNIINAKNSK